MSVLTSFPPGEEFTSRISPLIAGHVLMASLFLILSCRTATSPDTSRDAPLYAPSDSALSYFRADATDFALEELFATRHPDTSLVLVPERHILKFLLPLARLYDERSNDPLLDSLITLAFMHKQDISSLSLGVLADTSFAWVRNIRDGVYPTGAPLFDSLVELYDLGFRNQQYGWGLGGRTYFTTHHIPLNTHALGRAFLHISGVLVAEPNTIHRVYQNVEVLPGDGSTTIHMYLGFGDCPSGCYGYQRWTYSVSDRFEVQFMGHDPGTP